MAEDRHVGCREGLESIFLEAETWGKQLRNFRHWWRLIVAD